MMPWVERGMEAGCIQLLRPRRFKMAFTSEHDVVSLNLGLVRGVHAFDSERLVPSYVLPRTMRFHPRGTTNFWRGDRVDSDLFLFRLRPGQYEAFAEEARGKGMDRVTRVAEDLASPSVTALADAVRRFVFEGRPGGQVAEDSLSMLVHLEALRAMLEGATDQTRRRGLSKAKTRKAIDLIHERLVDGIGLTELASRLGLTPFHFCRAFKRSVGIAPRQYLLEARVLRARTLLETTRLGVGVIAERAGFASHPHMTSSFRRLLGLAPQSYRERFGE